MHPTTNHHQQQNFQTVGATLVVAQPLPIKQSHDHDPQGIFIRKWIPELSAIPEIHIHEPWKMTILEQQLYNFKLGQDYPLPVVDITESAKIARDKIWGHRKTSLVRQERKRIITTHTRNQPRKK